MSMLRWIIIAVVCIQGAVLQGACPIHCVCESGSSVCDVCGQWYLDPSSNCGTLITVDGTSFERYSKPGIKYRTVTTITVIFRQYYRQYYTTNGIEPYLYYGLQRKSQESEYTDNTPIVQHLTGLGANLARDFVIEGLQKNTAYQFRLVIYRRQNGIQQQLAVTSPTTGTTFCSELFQPWGVFASSGQLSFTVHWQNLFYDPSCEHAVVYVHFTNVDNVAGGGESRRIPVSYVANNPGSYTVTNVQASSYNVLIKVSFSNTSLVVYSDTVPVNVTVDPVPTQTKSPATSTMILCNTTTTSYQPYTDNSPTALPTSNNNPTILPTNDHNPTPETPSPTHHHNENTGQLCCSCTTLSTKDNNPTALPTNENSPTPLPIIENNPTHTNGNTTLPTNNNNPTSLSTNENNPTYLPTNHNNPTPPPTNHNSHIPQATNENNLMSSSMIDNNLTPLSTNENNPTSSPTNDDNPTPLPTNDNNPTHQITTHNNLTPLPTNSNGPTHQTPSSTLLQEGSTDRQLNPSFVCDYKLVTIPAAIVSVVVLILVVLLVCYIVSLRRKLKGMKTDRMGDFSDMYMNYHNSVTGDAITPAARTHRAAHGRNPNRAAGHPTPYYNTVTSAAVMPDTNVSIHGEAGGLYEEVAGSREPVRPTVYLGLGQHNNN